MFHNYFEDIMKRRWLTGQRTDEMSRSICVQTLPLLHVDKQFSLSAEWPDVLSSCSLSTRALEKLFEEDYVGLRESSMNQVRTTSLYYTGLGQSAAAEHHLGLPTPRGECRESQNITSDTLEMGDRIGKFKLIFT